MHPALASIGFVVHVAAQEPAPAPPPQPGTSEDVDLFHDEDDGAFDVSKFLDSRTGFLPIFMPITEPALGYGAVVGLAFFHTPPRVVDTPAGVRMLPPDVTMIGGMATDDGSWAGFGGHLHTWDDGRIRYLVGGGYGSLDLDWFGQGDEFAGQSFAYDLEAWAVMQKLTFKIGDSDFFAGPTQRFLATETSFDGDTGLGAGGAPSDIDGNELDTTVSGLGLNLGYDTRNSLFSPTRGTKASLDWTQSDEAIGSDFDYGTGSVESCTYMPLGGPWTLGVRGKAGYASDDTPYFDLASVQLRGIEAGRYVDNVALTLEGELRWDVTSRWTLVGFGGTGWVADQFGDIDDAQGHGAGGAGFRYLVARKYDMRIGLDFAASSDQEAIYVTVGTGWLRD